MRALHRTLAILGLDSKEVGVDDAMTYFRWRHSLQHARPVKMFISTTRPLGPRECVYHSRRLCYTTNKSNRVEILDLETGQKSKWIGEKLHDAGGGTLFWNYFLSDRYLVIQCECSQGQV